MPVNVSPESGNDSSHHISLTDADGTSVGFNCYNRSGDKDPTLATSPFPGYAAQLRQGRGKHSDRVPPFEDIPMSDFSGGLAMLHYDEDKSRYLDGKRCDTSRQGEVVHAGLETYMAGLRDFNESWAKDVSWLSMYSGGTETKSIAVTANASYNAESVVLLLKKVGSPTGNITVTLADSDDANPQTKVLAVGTDCLTDLVSERVEFVLGSVKALTDTTAYKLTVAYAGGSATEYVDVGVDGSGDLYYRVLDDTSDFKILTFEYHGAFYAVTQPDDMTASKLYLLGYRGVADANTGALTTLVDAAETFATNEIDLVVIVGGAGSNEEQPWRTASSNNGTTITVSPAWNIEHDTTTEYVAFSNRWQLLQTFAKYVTDVTVVGRHVIFAFGNAQKYKRYRVYNNSGAFAETLSAVGRTSFTKVIGYKTEIGNYDFVGGEVYGYDTQAYNSEDAPRRMLLKYTLPYLFADLYSDKAQVLEPAALMDTTAIANCTHFNFNGMSCVTVAAGFATGDVAHKTITSNDFTRGEYLGFYAYSSVALSAGDWEIGYADSGGNRINLDIPALAAATWTWVEIELTPQPSKTGGSVDESDITDIYLQQDVDKGAMDFYIRDGFGIRLLGDGVHTDQKWFLPDNIKVNNLVQYMGGAGEVQSRPWLLGPDGWFYLSGTTIVPVVLDEMKELAHPRTGEGVTVNDVNLYSNIGETIQSFYSGSLRSVGPDVDYGLPANRRGIPCSMASYPGKVITCIDAGTNGYSSVIYRRNHGWHELYRAPYGKRIRNIHVVGYTGEPDRVFISEGADVLSVPISINAETEDGYEYAWESVLETSRIYGGLRETEKYYHAISLVTENLSTTNRYIQVDYRTSEDSTYTTIGSDFITSPRQRQSLTSDNDTDGRWIQFRFRSYTNDRTETPKLVSAILDSIEINPVKDLFTYTIGLKEGYNTDLRGTQEDLTGEAALTQLKTWRDDPRPLTLGSISSFENGKLIKLEGLNQSVLYQDVGNIEQEFRLVTMQCIEVV